MTVLITLVLPIGGDAGPFNLYSDTDGYVTPFATNISASALIAGYIAINVPEGTTIIRVQSVGVCTNFVNVPVNVLPTTTTTSSSSTTSTSTTAGPTTTTTSSSSTTTSTTTAIPCNCVTFYNGLGTDQEITYIDCNGDLQSGMINAGATDSYCGCCGDAPNPAVIITEGGACILGVCPTTTTTTTCACVNFDVVIGPIDIAESIVDVQYVNCAGDTTVTSSDVVTTFSICVQSGTVPLIYRETPPTSVVDSSVTITSECCTSPTTSTTTTGV